MRLIDADAFAIFLKDAIKRQEYEDTKIDGLLTVADVIEAVISELDGTSHDGFENAPTIDPERKTGKWIEAYDPYNRISGRCSVCGWEAHLYEDDVIGMPFCPHCGAEMEN